MAVLIKWNNRTPGATQRLWRNTSPFDITNLPSPSLATLENSESEFRDDTVVAGVEYFYAIETISGSDSVLSELSSVVPGSGVVVEPELDIQSIFLNSEPGFWYDPSDLSTLFQDTLGEVPVTAIGQSVGLVLDKSQGGGLGDEEVTNGDFSVATGWSLSSATIGSGTLNVSSGAFRNVATQAYSGLPVGSLVRVTFDVVARTSGVIAFFIGALNLASKVTPDISTTGSFSFLFEVGAASGNFFFRAEAGGFVGTIDNISVRILLGTHAMQETLSKRPTYQEDAEGNPYLSFDGAGDALVTQVLTPAIDKVQVFAGVRKDDDDSVAILLELSSSTGSNLGSFYVTAPETTGAGGDYKFQSRGSGSAAPAPAAAPGLAGNTNVVTGLGDINAPSKTIRLDGVQLDQTTDSQGSGNYDPDRIYIGGRGGSSLYFDGRLYGLIVRFGADLTPETIDGVENYLAGKSGIEL